jgi:hypothetical protein
MRRNPLRRGAGPCQVRRRVRVAGGALAGRQTLIDGSPHDRMDEAQPPHGGQDAGRGQPIGRDARAVLAQTGRAGRQPGLDAVAQHGHRPRQLPRLGSDRIQPGQRQPGHRVGADAADQARRLRRWLHLTGVERA